MRLMRLVVYADCSTCRWNVSFSFSSSTWIGASLLNIIFFNSSASGRPCANVFAQVDNTSVFAAKTKSLSARPSIL